MEMAKATPTDLKAAIDLSNAMDALSKGFLPPEMTNPSGEDSDRYDAQQHAAAVLEHLCQIAAQGSLFRVSFGMSVLLDPANEVVDPTATTLQFHPKFGALDAAARRMLSALDKMALGCDKPGFQGIQNGLGENAGDEVQNAREALITLTGHKSTAQHQNQSEKA